MAKYAQFLEFSEQFPDERACEEHLEQSRWGGKITCPHCEHEKCYKKIVKRKVMCRKTEEKKCVERLIYRCGKCKKDFSGRTGMMFEESRVPLRVWYFCIYEAVSRSGGVSSVEVAERMGVTQKTAWFLMHRVREAMKTDEFNAPLKGTVEVDESGYTTGYTPKDGEKRKRGRGSQAKTSVACAIERKGQVRCKVVADVKSKTLIPFVRQNVQIGTEVFTDEFRSYLPLKNNGYNHDTVEHGIKEYARGKVHTNTAEGFFGNTKAKLRGTHSRVSAKHLQRYCDHYVWLYNRMELSAIDRFNDWLNCCVGRLTYDSLTA